MTPNVEPDNSGQGRELNGHEHDRAHWCPQRDLIGLKGILSPETLQVLAEKNNACLCAYRATENLKVPQQTDALVLTVKEAGDRLKVSTLDLPTLQETAQLVELFEQLPIEHFEARFEKLGAQVVEKHKDFTTADAVESSSSSDYYPTNCDLVCVYQHHRGSVVKLLDDQVNDDIVLVIAASQDKNPEEYVIRIPKDRWSQHCQDAIENLIRSEDSAIRQGMGELAKFARDESVVYSDYRSPTATIIDNLVSGIRTDVSPELFIEARPDRTPEEATERILERRQSLMVRFRDGQSNISMWKKMFVTSTDDGVGFVVLCVGRKDARNVLDDTRNSPTHGRARYDFDLSDLSPWEKQEWLNQLLQAFARSRQDFPGAITEFLSAEAKSTKPDGNERVRLASLTGLKKANLNHEESVIDFQRRISRILKSHGLDVSHDNSSPAKGRISCSNSCGDTLFMTIKPHGIESIVVAPRHVVGGSSGCGAKFSLGSIYQLNENFPPFISQLGSLFARENGQTQLFRAQNRMLAGPIGAQLVLNYLNGACAPSTSSAKHGSMPPSFDAVRMDKSR